MIARQTSGDHWENRHVYLESLEIMNTVRGHLLSRCNTRNLIKIRLIRPTCRVHLHNPVPSSCRFISVSTFSPHKIIHTAEWFLDGVHSYTHLPWWAVITCTTFILRSLVTLPLAVHQNKILAKMELLKPTLKEYQEAVKHNVIVKCRRNNVPLDEANRRVMKEVREICITASFVII